MELKLLSYLGLQHVVEGLAIKSEAQSSNSSSGREGRAINSSSHTSSLQASSISSESNDDHSRHSKQSVPSEVGNGVRSQSENLMTPARLPRPSMRIDSRNQIGLGFASPSLNRGEKQTMEEENSSDESEERKTNTKLNKDYFEPLGKP